MKRTITTRMIQGCLAICAAAFMPDTALAAGDVAVHGSVSADILFPEEDKEIGTEEYNSWILFNTYADVNLYSRYVDAGLRFEFMRWPMPGYEKDFAGWGIPNIYVKGKYKGFELTAGDFYEQFGSGFILRTYEDRPLGIDNSLRGGRLNITALKGFKFSLLGGVQRHYWNWDKHSQIYGANAETYLQDYMTALQDHNASWMIGASYVLHHEDDQQIDVPGVNYRLNLPKYVNAFDVRSSFNKGPWNVLGEFAWKGQDPNFNNGYTYGPGTAYLLSGSFSKKGISAMLQAKRSENMAFRSDRLTDGTAVFINNMPAFSYNHTYALPALYPYSTQTEGEWAFQGSFGYTFKRKTPLGGKYGTKISVDASYISGLVASDNPQGINGGLIGTNGRDTYFWKIGACNYYDINVQFEKRLSGPVQLNLMYAHQYYNNEVLKTVETDDDFVRANVVVADVKYKINKKFTLRAEAQYLSTEQDQKDWAYGLVEFSWTPYLMISASDMWNCGETGRHYYMFGVTGNYRANRLMIQYGRTRKGYNCSGGVCRPVPAMHGLMLTYSYNF